jgi:YHS domain-containing protein
MKIFLSSVALLLAAAGAASFTQEKPQPKPAAQVTADPAADAKVVAQQLPSYPLTTCPISHDALEAGKAVNLVHEGRLVRFCCKDCVAGFKKDPAPVLKMIDEAVVKAQAASYPLKTCPISGEELGGSMGAPVDVVQGTRLVRLCCKSCTKTLAKDPAKVLAQVDAALITEQKKTYPLKTCLVSGEAIKGEGVDHLYGTRLTRFCCEKCIASFDKEPAKYLAQLDKK